MLKEAIGDKFEYTKLTPEEQQKRGILGRLAGVIADFKKPTRNGRLYSEELWDKVFKDPIMQEKIQTKTILGELGHPEGRIETDMAKIAICLSEEPQKFKDGTIRGVFDILDTPNGRILKTLCDYGCDIGVSSRGEGDIVEKWDGESEVDPSTYTCECWDAVLLPAVKAARLKMVESLERKSGKTFNQAICEALERTNPDGRKIQEETLKNLNIDYTPEKVDNKEESINTSKEESEKAIADDDGINLEEDLKDALMENKQLKNRIKDLQEKLSVCYAKETSNEEEISKLKNCIISLTESSKSLKTLKPRLDSLKEQLAQKDKLIEEQKTKISKLFESQKSQVEKRNLLNESISENRKRVTSLISENNSLKEDFNQYKKEASNNQRVLNEKIEELKKDSALKKSEFDSKLLKANSLTERYQRMARLAVDKLIESKATMLGVSPNEIKSKLPNNYSFDDIDNICEELQQYQVNLSKLPLTIKQSRDRNYKIAVKESVEPILPKSRFDDNVDDSLLSLAGLKK